LAIAVLPKHIVPDMPKVWSLTVLDAVSIVIGMVMRSPI
jgi:hypothetical protein